MNTFPRRKVARRSTQRVRLLRVETLEDRRVLAAGFFQGFEVDDTGWDVFGAPKNATRVASGTNGIVSKTGSFHGETAGVFMNGIGAATPFGASEAAGHTAAFPTGGYTNAIDVYLDIDGGGYANDTRFDYSVSNNKPDLTHRREFAFNAGYYTDSDATGSGPRFVISTSNNVTRSGAFPKNPTRDPFTVTAEGWYTFQHNFYDAGGGVLAVDLILRNAVGTTLKTWTLSDPTDIIGTTVGGNRDGWFVLQEFPFLAFDNSLQSGGVIASIDFNTDTSPTAAGSVGLGGVNAFKAARGYGWSYNGLASGAQNIPSMDRGAAFSDLLRDAHHGVDKYFLFNVSPGTYEVKLVIGDPSSRVDAVDVYAEGVLKLDGVSTAFGAHVTPTFVTTVTDGQLTLRLKKDGGSPAFPNWVISGLTISTAPAPPMTVPATSSGDAPSVSEADLAPVIADAIARWAQSGIDSTQVADLQKVHFRVADLDMLRYAGVFTPGEIVVDDNGNGFGWNMGSATNSASTRMDLLTVISHELGHALGFSDLYAAEHVDDVMHGILLPGERRTPAAAAVALPGIGVLATGIPGIGSLSDGTPASIGDISASAAFGYSGRQNRSGAPLAMQSSAMTAAASLDTLNHAPIARNRPGSPASARADLLAGRVSWTRLQSDASGQEARESVFGDLGRPTLDREAENTDLSVWELEVADDPQVASDAPRLRPAAVMLTDEELDKIYAQAAESDVAEVEADEPTS